MVGWLVSTLTKPGALYLLRKCGVDRKTVQFGVEFKSVGEEDSGSFVGRGAGIGNMDRGGDVFLPGCFDGVLDAFVKQGAILKGHDWGDAPIGFVETATADDKFLTINARFHSTDDAQEIRTVMFERAAAGKDVGLSVGFRIAEAMEFANGAELYQWATAKSYKVDPSCKKYPGYCRAILKVGELYEVSFVNVPMNPKATAARVKSASSEDDGAHTGLTLDEHFSIARAGLKSLTERVASLQVAREDEGRTLSKVREAELSALRDEIDGLIARVKAHAPRKKSLYLKARLAELEIGISQQK